MFFWNNLQDVYKYIYIFKKRVNYYHVFYEDFTEVDNKPLRRGSWILDPSLIQDLKEYKN